VQNAVPTRAKTVTCTSDTPRRSASIFGIAEKYGGTCNLRFRRLPNPVKEEVEYVDSIMEDIEWLGFHWDNVYYASDYFQQLWDFAEKADQGGQSVRR